MSQEQPISLSGAARSDEDMIKAAKLAAQEERDRLLGLASTKPGGVAALLEFLDADEVESKADTLNRLSKLATRAH